MHATRTLVALAVLALAARADVIVVDPQGGDGSIALQTAIDAAHPGDILLLKAESFLGALPSIVITQSGLTLVPDGTAGQPRLPPLELHDLAETETLVLRGIRVLSAAVLTDAAAVSIKESPAATVWLEDCDIRGSTSATGVGIWAVRAGGTRLAIVRSTLVGGDGAEPLGFNGNGGTGLFLGYFGPMIQTLILDSTIRGGHGGPGIGATGSSGGDGVVCSEDLFVAGSTIVGGDEGEHNDPKPGQAGDGITIFVPGAKTLVHVRDCTLAAGQVQGAGTPGKASGVPPLEFAEFPAAWRSIRLPAVVREHHVGVLRATGQTGDLVAALVDLDGELLPSLLSKQGAFAVDPLISAGPLPIGVITDGSGTLSQTFTLPDLPAGLDGVRVFVQGVFAGADGVTLGSASAMAWISAAF